MDLTVKKTCFLRFVYNFCGIYSLFLPYSLNYPPGGLLRTHLLDIVPEPKVLTTSTSLQSKPKVRPGGGGIVCKYVGTICKLCWALLNVTYKHIVTFLNVMLAVRACFDPTFVFKKIKI